MSVKWIVQRNLINEEDLGRLRAASSDKVIIDEIDVVPFTEELPEFTLPAVFYGSVSMIDRVYQQKIKAPSPKSYGVFFDPNDFTVENYLLRYGKKMLNYGGYVTTMKKFAASSKNKESHWFIRPDADNKAFCGEVIKYADFEKWYQQIAVFANKEAQVTRNTKIFVSQPYTIEKEWRVFIVEGQAVTGSQYRELGRLKKAAVSSDVLKFAEECAGSYSPQPVFVMDIALCGGSLYVLELGCFNSAGFYASDIEAILLRVSDYFGS